MILVPAGLALRITLAAEAAWPGECCGLLVGSGTWRRLEVSRVVEAPNLMEGTLDRFEIDPRIRLATEKACRGTPTRIVGHYHSHPDGSARPSATDLAQAWEPELAWLIVAVAAGRVVGMQAHRLDERTRRFRPLALAAP